MRTCNPLDDMASEALARPGFISFSRAHPSNMFNELVIWVGMDRADPGVDISSLYAGDEKHVCVSTKLSTAAPMELTTLIMMAYPDQGISISKHWLSAGVGPMAVSSDLPGSQITDPVAYVDFVIGVVDRLTSVLVRLMDFPPYSKLLSALQALETSNGLFPKTDPINITFTERMNSFKTQFGDTLDPDVQTLLGTLEQRVANGVALLREDGELGFALKPLVKLQELS